MDHSLFNQYNLEEIKREEESSHGSTTTTISVSPPPSSTSSLSSFTCTDCGAPHRSRLDVEAHQMKVHGGREYVCDFCGIGYSIQEYLDGHKQYVHPVCEQCHRQFITCPELEEHMRNHQELVRIKRELSEPTEIIRLPDYSRGQPEPVTVPQSPPHLFFPNDNNASSTVQSTHPNYLAREIKTEYPGSLSSHVEQLPSPQAPPARPLSRGSAASSSSTGERPKKIIRLIRGNGQSAPVAGTSTGPLKSALRVKVSSIQNGTRPVMHFVPAPAPAQPTRQSDGRWFCSGCGKRFASALGLSTHLEIHIREEGSALQSEGTSQSVFTSPSPSQSHQMASPFHSIKSEQDDNASEAVLEVHGTPGVSTTRSYRRYSCKACPKYSTNCRETFSSHLTMYHSGDTGLAIIRHHCPLCSVSFKSRELLPAHMKSHEGVLSVRETINK